MKITKILYYENLALYSIAKLNINFLIYIKTTRDDLNKNTDITHNFIG